MPTGILMTHISAVHSHSLAAAQTRSIIMHIPYTVAMSAKTLITIRWQESFLAVTSVPFSIPFGLYHMRKPGHTLSPSITHIHSPLQAPSHYSRCRHTKAYIASPSLRCILLFLLEDCSVLYSSAFSSLCLAALP